MTSGTGPPSLDRLVGIPLGRPVHPPATDLVGRSVAGHPMDVAVTGVEGLSLLLFLSTHCDGCRPLWEAWARPSILERSGMPQVARVLAVVAERASEQLHVLAAWCATPADGAWAPGPERLVRSDAAWAFYKVFGPPFYALVDGPAGVIATEGVAWAVGQVAAEVDRAVRQSATGPASSGPGRDTGPGTGGH